jgi:hypothetical protein
MRWFPTPALRRGHSATLPVSRTDRTLGRPGRARGRRPGRPRGAGSPSWIAALAVVGHLVVAGPLLGGQTGDPSSPTQEIGGRSEEPVPVDGVPLSYEAAADARVEVDGVLSEPVWTTAEVVTLPYEAFPGSNTPAPVATECRLAYDDQALYMGCRARDPSPSGIRAYITDRDDLDGQDAVVLGLSPFDDGRRAFVFAVNPLGVQSDAMYDEASGSADMSWDAIWESAGRVVEDGYVVELAVPFRSLRFPRLEGAGSWAFYVERTWPRGADVRVQSFFEAEGDACRLCQVNRLTGLRGIAPGRNVQLTPTLAAGRTDTRALESPEWSEGSLSSEVGLDVLWGVTSDITLNATINPDFSQVEADAAQLDVNRRFALFFPERRPFFQEGADLFSTPLQLAFTRTIVDPRFGGKATGKLGGNAFGGLLAVDAVNGFLIPGPFGSASALVEEDVTTGLGTYRRDIGGTATAGALVTAREGADYHNRVAAADLFLRPLPPVRVRFQVAGSSTRYPAIDATADQPDGTFGGSAVFAEAFLDNRTWVGSTGFQRLGRRFRADAGFVPAADRQEAWGWMSRRWYGTSSSWLSQFTLAAGGWRGETTGGELINGGGWVNVAVSGPWQSAFNVNPNMSRERYQGRTYDLRSVYTRLQVRPTRWLGATIVARAGDAVDYANARPAQMLRLEPVLALRPGRHLDVELAHGYQRLSTESGDPVLAAHVSRARFVYNFTPRAFVRAVVQYRHTGREPDLYSAPVDRVRESSLSQLLFSYKVNPQTVVFLGYSDNREGLTGIDRDRIPLSATGRSLFLKVGYAFRP